MGDLEPLERLAAVLARLPGVGRRSAQRMAYALVRPRGHTLRDLAAALKEVEARVAACSRCGAVTLRGEDPCRFCADPRRDGKILCVVEDALDLLTLEASGGYRGRYHVLGGRLSPMRGEGVEDLRLRSLAERVRAEGFEEVILALNFDVESEATCALIRELLGAAVRRGGACSCWS